MQNNAVTSSNITKKGDFIEIEYTGYNSGKPFDSNIESDLKKINKDAKPVQTIIIIGQKMVVAGLDSALVGKTICNQYKVALKAIDAFGNRQKDLVKTIPLKIFHAQKIDPRPGATLLLDNRLVKVLTVSGARVITDFNHPLAGKDVDYVFTITRLVTDVKEKVTTICNHVLRFVPNFEVAESIVFKGPKMLESYIMRIKPIIQELMGLNCTFVEVAQEKVSKQA